jgi:hypothetical protein
MASSTLSVPLLPALIPILSADNFLPVWELGARFCSEESLNIGIIRCLTVASPEIARDLINTDEDSGGPDPTPRNSRLGGRPSRPCLQRSRWTVRRKIPISHPVGVAPFPVVRDEDGSTT